MSSSALTQDTKFAIRAIGRSGGKARRLYWTFAYLEELLALGGPYPTDVTLFMTQSAETRQRASWLFVDDSDVASIVSETFSLIQKYPTLVPLANVTDKVRKILNWEIRKAQI